MTASTGFSGLERQRPRCACSASSSSLLLNETGLSSSTQEFLKERRRRHLVQIIRALRAASAALLACTAVRSVEHSAPLAMAAERKDRKSPAG